MDPDALIATMGEAVTQSRITVPVSDAVGVFSETLSTVVTAALKAIVSQPSEKQLPPRLQGGQQQAFLLALPSSTDVVDNRPGRPDRFTVRGALCEVTEVRRDTHPLTRATLLNVLVTRVATPLGTP